ncbi:MAG: 5-guanidino-2-oxopentanoate decarboxylase [Halieaceae bacterium]
MVTCGERLVQLLEARGVDTVFGIPGNHTVELYRGLASSGLRHISPRHEQGAGFMADGYARATGRPGVCFLISGPGLTNALTPMMQAMADSVPMLVISAVAARHQLGMGEGHLHELPDQRALAAQCTRFSHTLMRPDELPRVLARAFAVFDSERPGPVHIEIPLDVITADASHLALDIWPTIAPPGAAAYAVSEAAALLAQARAPVIVAGGGAINAAPDVQIVAEQLDAPVVNTVNGKGLLPSSHPLAVGSSPSISPVRELLKDADLVLALGTEFGETDFDMLFLGDLALSAPLIRVDIDARQLCRNQRPALAIHADCGEFLRQLQPLLAPAAQADGAARVAAVKSALPTETHFHKEFQDFFDLLQTTLPEMVLVGDSTLPTYYAVWQYETQAPRRYFHSATGGGTLGYAIPAALGAKLAKPDVPVVALIGDGSAQFTLPELASGAAAGLAVAVIVWNNAGYKEIEQGMVAAGITPVGVDIAPPDFIQAAKALGCEALRATTPETLRQALLDSQARDVPTVIELQQADFITLPAGGWYQQ